MTLDERLEFLVKSQESLGDNIQKLYEVVSANERRLNKLNKAVLLGIRAALEEFEKEDENGEKS